MLDDPHALKLYIDGNCYRNPGGAGAIACVCHFPDDWNREDEIVFDEGFHETTNNRMELRACVEALEYVAKHGRTLGVSRVIIVTDSIYVHEHYQRADEWRANGWKTSSGRPVENPDLWKQFLTARGKVPSTLGQMPLELSFYAEWKRLIAIRRGSGVLKLITGTLAHNPPHIQTSMIARGCNSQLNLWTPEDVLGSYPLVIRRSSKNGCYDKP
jgi:ribonuclease HI